MTFKKESNLNNDKMITHEEHILRNENQLAIASINNSYIAAATSKNTRRAYQADIRHFEMYGGKLPANIEVILAYLQKFATKLSPRTLSRRLTALKNWHIYQEFPDPTQNPLVSKTLAGIMRTHGKPKDKAPPLLPEHLLEIVACLTKEKTLRACRDSALLQVAFFGALRRSEVVAILYEHIEWKEQGIDILIPHSKTDQMNEGQYCAIPYGDDHLCPVNALKLWIEQSGITKGAIFRRLYPNGCLDEAPLVPLSVSNILKKRAHNADLPQAENFTSHSLRRGLATSASRDGASIPAIMRQGRWKNVNTVMEYIEAANRFEENAAASILKKIHQI